MPRTRGYTHETHAAAPELRQPPSAATPGPSSPLSAGGGRVRPPQADAVRRRPSETAPPQLAQPFSQCGSRCARPPRAQAPTPDAGSFANGYYYYDT